MKVSTKAAIYSGLVFPGSGYFVVKSHKRGALVALLAVSWLGVMCYEAYGKAQIITEKILRGTIQFDVIVIREQINETPGIINPEFISGLSIAIAIVWVISIIDSYRIGRIKDLSQTLPNKS